MNTYLLYWEYLINFLEAGTFYYYTRILLPPKKTKHHSIFFILLIFIRMLVISVCNTFQFPVIYNIIICSLYNSVIVNMLFQEKFSICAFWGILHNLLCITSDFTSMLFLCTFSNVKLSDMLFGKPYRFPATSLYIIILAGLSFYIPTLVSKNVLFKGTQKIFIIIFTLLGMTIIHYFMLLILQLEPIHTEALQLIILANIVFLCFFIFLLVYMYQLALTQQKNEELQARTKLLELETAQYNNLVSTTDSLRIIKHDIHHHLFTIHSLIQNKEIERLTHYLTEYQTHFDLDYLTVSTGNIVIDSILSTKLYSAKKQNTLLDFSVVLPKQFPFTDVALSALLGNLFDNALEACAKLSLEEKRWICFHIKIQEEMLIIHMENTFDGIVKETRKHTFLSRKKELHHGVGLNRVNTLVEEVGGFIEIRCKEQIFIIHIIIPLEETNEI